MNQTEQNVKTTNIHSAGRMSASRLEVLAIVSLQILGIVLWSCADPRNEPSTAPDPGYTQTIVLAEHAVSNGQPVPMSFEVQSQLAPIILPGQDQPARLFVTAYIGPDSDIDWYELIVLDSIPAWDDQIVLYQIAIVAAQSDIEDYTVLADSCEVNPDCSADSLAELNALIAAAEEVVAANQDSVAMADAEIARLGVDRDSLAVLLDDRYQLSIQFDNNAFVAYPNAVFADTNMTLAGQNIYLAATDTNGITAKTFTLDMAAISAADTINIGHPIELNWTTCSSAERPCLSVGPHSFEMSVAGDETWVSAVLVLVYAEER